MKTGIKTFCKLVVIMGIALFSHFHSIHAQPAFPNPDIQKNQSHEGDLVLTGDQTMTIENTHYKVNGSIFLYDSSKLIIRHSVIELSGGPAEGNGIRCRDSSMLQADTTIFGGATLTGVIDASQVESIKIGDIWTEHNSRLTMNNCFSLSQTFMGNSKVIIRNSYFWKEPLGLVHVEGTADVLFEDSFVGAFFIAIPNSVPVVIDSLLPGYLDYWSAQESITEHLDYNLVLKRTVVMENTMGYKGGVEIGWNIAVDALKANVTISNSKLHKMLLGFPDKVPATLSNLVTRKPMNFDLNNIHLINTEVQTQWGVFMEDGPANIIDSEGLFIFMTGGDADVHVFNSEVGEIDPRNYSGTLIFENSTWLGGYEIFDSSSIKIRGSVRMLPTAPLFDQSSTMTRTYDVVLLDDLDESPFDNINLTLSKNGTVIWNGKTNADGKATFDIIFNYDNNGDEWVLTTDANHIKLNKTFSINTSNPVIINLEQEEGSTQYRSVIHVVSGNPGMPLGTRGSPYPAIQEAIDNSGGDIIHVHPGIYQGEIAPGKTRGGIALKDSVTILGAGADSTILAGIVNAENAKGVSISGLRIEDGIHSLSSSLSLSNSVIADYAGTAIWGSFSDFNLVNNVFAGNGQDAIFLHDSTTAVIKNNIIVNNAGFGINGMESASASIDYNNVWGNAEDSFESFSVAGNNISEDPQFVNSDSGEFHLQAGSPCIDTGDPDPKFNDPDGSRNDMGVFGGPLSTQIATGIDNVLLFTPGKVALFQNIPNPFNEQTTIHFELSRDEWFKLTIYNMVGQKVRILVDERRKAGHYSISWDAKDEEGNRVRNGIYFYQISTNETSSTKKAILLK
jgi:parallel beta-helix repeat protein